MTLCNAMDYSPPGSCVHGIFQARILEWVATFYSRGSSQPRDWTHISCISCSGRWILDHCATWEALFLGRTDLIFLTAKVIGELAETRAQSWPLVAPQGQAGFSWKSCLVCVGTKSPQSCLTLCDPMDCRPPDASIHGIFQAGMLEWIAMPSSRGSSQPRDQTHICMFCIGERILYH